MTSQHVEIRPDARGSTVPPTSHDGLTSEEAQRLLAEHGENAIVEEHVSLLSKLLSYFWGPIPWMIEAAAILSASVQRWEDFIIIMAMLMLNAGVGFWEEYKADTAIEALKRRLAPSARVLRDGTWQTLPARLLVAGDLISIKLGNIVPADVKLLEGDELSIDQSALTGESLPVDLKAGDTAYSGSVVKLGEMRAVVTATGMGTYFGKTVHLVETAHQHSHFQKAVLRIGNFLILTTLALVALILLVALFRQSPLTETLLFALILTVAAIPVALPAVLSVTMAVGAITLSRMKAIVSHLASIEEMAGMDVLCTDKTGTLTKNELKLGDIVPIGAEPSEILVAAALTCDREGPDSIDQAILAGLPSENALDGYDVAHLTPFDPVRKRAEAEVRQGGRAFRVAKGAPQVMVALAGQAPEIAKTVNGHVDELAAHGYRTLAVARADRNGDWRVIGLLPLFDPPREDSAATIAETKRMGLDVRMVTGDNGAIAREMARMLGLGTEIVSAHDLFPEGGPPPEAARIENAAGFSEVFPEHKFKIVTTLQEADHIVGMTGDGVNDAPALKQADIGIAVSGATDAARGAADLVLTEPGLSVITHAIEESRRIFERMTSYATFRIAETIRVLVFMSLSILVFDFYPVTAVMIVLLAILNDFPIMMIAYDNVPVAPTPVRWNMERVLTISSVLGLVGVVGTFVLFWIAERYLMLPREQVQTLIFLKLLVAGHLTIYVTRNEGWFWQRPWPSWRLIVTTETTQVLGTLAAVYGWLVTPLGWRYALLVWGYALVWFAIGNIAKIWTLDLLHHGHFVHRRYISRIYRR